MSSSDGENRNIPGDRLVSRILTRVRRRPRLGMSPDFYARFGMSDPWTAPEFVGEDPTAAGGMVFLSAQPYYAMMRRLAAARRRRERREAAFQGRHAGGAARMKAMARRWPGETAASLVVSRVARVALDDMTLPRVIAPVAAPVVAEPGAAPAASTGRRISKTLTNRGAAAWLSTPSTPARVFSATGEDLAAPRADAVARPPAARHAGARLAAATSSASPAARALADAIPTAVGARRHQLARIVDVIEALPPEEQEVQIRRVVRRLGASAPVARAVVEEAAPAGAPVTRPSQVAARRADPVQPAGLRPVLGRSPAMALAAAPEVDRAASGTLATAERSAERAGSAASLARLPRRAASSQRALARGAAAQPGASSVPAPLAYARAAAAPALSASPVLRAAAPAASAGAPRASAAVSGSSAPSRAVRAVPRAAGRNVAAPPAELYFGEVVAAPAATRRTASARAVARLVASPMELVSAERLEPTQGAVRSAEGVWASAREVAPARRDPSVRPSERLEPASAHAAARVDAGRVEGRSVLPRAIPSASDRVLAALPAAPVVVAAALSASPVARPARAERVVSSSASSPSGSTPVRTAEGTWVPARSPSGRAVAAGSDAGSLPGSGAPSVAARAGARLALPEAAVSASPVAPAGERRAAAAARPAVATTLGGSAFRTAEPAAAAAPAAATGSVATASRASEPARAAARPAAVRANVQQDAGPRSVGVAHAARRAELPVAAPIRRAVGAAVERAPAYVAPVGARAAASAVPARAERGDALRASILRAPAMAHASARTDLPADVAGLQPQVSPQVSAAQRSVSSAVAPSRVATVAAAARLARSPVLSAAGARVLAELAAPASATPARSRFSRTGPLAFALSPSAAVAPASGPVKAAAAPRAVARARVRASRVFTTPSSAYSPSSAVTTPSGVWISARTAAATPGMRIVRDEAGRLVALAPAPEAPAASARSRAPASAGATLARPGYAAPVDDAADALIAPAPAARRRASEWASERTRVVDATAYRGAYRAAEPVASTASSFTTPDGTVVGATVARDTRESRTPARRDRPRRVSAMAGEMALASSAAPTATPSGMPASGGVVSTGAGAGRGARPAGRQPFEERLHGVAMGAPVATAPAWAARSDGAPRVRSPGGLFEALARATSAEEIVRVIYARSEGVRETPLAREAPVVQVIEQIRQEVRQEVRREQSAGEAVTRATRMDAPAATTIRNNYVQPVQSTTRVNRGGVRGVGATARAISAGGGDDRVTKLVKKLQGLIHLAEAEGRLADARAQVRMAEDSASAKAEGQGPVGATREGGEKGQKQDIDALGREVLEVVTRELEFRRSRRVEDHDESNWW